MESFSIVALQLLPDCSKHIRKVLQEDWYFFTQKYHLDPDTKYPIRNPDYKLPDDFFDPKISISAIVGKNGCGKSTIVEIMLRVINNFAVNITAKAHKDCQLYPVSDVNAALYFEIDGKLNFIETSKAGILWGIIGTFGKRVHPNKIEKTTPLEKALQQLRQFFFTIVNNYSFHSYNVDDYGEESVGKDKIWINSLFHKNDGYLTPIFSIISTRNSSVILSTIISIVLYRLVIINPVLKKSIHTTLFGTRRHMIRSWSSEFPLKRRGVITSILLSKPISVKISGPEYHL